MKDKNKSEEQWMIVHSSFLLVSFSTNKIQKTESLNTRKSEAVEEDVNVLDELKSTLSIGGTLDNQQRATMADDTTLRQQSIVPLKNDLIEINPQHTTETSDQYLELLTQKRFINTYAGLASRLSTMNDFVNRQKSTLYP